MAIDRAIDRLTNAVGGGSGPVDYDDFISGNVEKVTFKGELVPHYAFAFKKNLKEVYLPNATYIGVEAFSKNSSAESATFYEHSFDNLVLEKVVAPEVTTIDFYAFDSSTLKEVITGGNLSLINSYAFDHCTNLKSFNFNEGLVFIGYNAFMYSGLFSVKIPKTVEFIGDAAFSNCFNLKVVDLTDFDVNESETPWPTFNDNYLFGDLQYLSNDFKIYFKNQETLDAYVSNGKLSNYTSYFIVGTPPEVVEDSIE